VAAERGGLIKKRKEHSWVKLQTFPTNVGQDNEVLSLVLTPELTLDLIHNTIFSSEPMSL